MHQFVSKKYSLAHEFGLPVDPAAMMVGYEHGHPAVPPKMEDYVFDINKVKDMLAFWQTGLKALKIMGDPATGKTSFIEQWHSRLGWPLRKVACSRNTEAHRLIGHLVPTETGMLKWVDGPMVAAAREGSSLLLDEFNTMSPDEATGLNMLLEGYSFTIEETGEVIVPQKNFRVFATENSVHSGLNITGRNLQDVANDDRWMLMDADYMPAEMETTVVLKSLQSLYPRHTSQDLVMFEMVAKSIVDIANSIRVAYRKGESCIDKPMSTRAAIRWAKLAVKYESLTKDKSGRQVGDNFLYALHRSFAMSQEMSVATENMAKAKLGIA